MKNWKDIVVGPETPVLDTLRVIDQGTEQIALVCDASGRLVGTVSDGDVRRALLKGIGMDQPVSAICNTTPITAQDGTDRESVLTLMRNHAIRHIPIVNQNGLLVRVEAYSDHHHCRPLPNEVVLMAGGLGSRLGELTANCPKPLLKVGGKPILETILESFIDQGFRRFTFSVNYLSEMVENHFGDGSRWGCEFSYLRENKRMGTAGALSLIKNRPEHPFFVMNGDILTNVNFRQMLDYHSETGAPACMAVKELSIKVPYGVVNADENLRMVSLDEKPEHTFFVNAGIYTLDPAVLDMVPSETFYDMPSLFRDLMDRGTAPATFPLREYWLDIGRLEDFERANCEYPTHFQVTPDTE